MENRAHALAAGLFTLVLLAALIAVASWFRDDAAVRDRYLLVARQSVSGLNVQAVVRLRGVEVGRVESIRFDPADPQAILITALIDRGTPLTQGTRATLGYQGVTGLAFIELTDDGGKPQRLEADARAPVRIPVDPSLLDQLASNGPGLIASVEEVARRAARLLSDDNQAAVVATLNSMQLASNRLAALADQAQPVLAQTGPALKATTGVANDASLAIRRADQFIGQATTLAQQFGQRLESIDRIAKSAEQLGNVGQALGEAVVSVALPKIGDFIDELSRNSRALERALSDFQEHPQSLVFGRGPIPPGPGESGFVAPVRR
jgi:phospholipid/cholesterol/gamma-HCH transport system substrate-binding protein